jgi:hypothetical protein
MQALQLSKTPEWPQNPIKNSNRQNKTAAAAAKIES